MSRWKWGRHCRCDDQSPHGAVAVGLKLECALAGVLESCGAEVVRKAQDAEADAQRLFRMDPSRGLFTQQGGRSRPDGLSALKELLVTELDDRAMALRAMSGR